MNSSGTKLGEAQRYFIKDHLGSIGLITDEIGYPEQTNFFDPWGRERKIVTSGSIKQWLANNDNYKIANKPITTRGFTGHEQLAEVGLIHMNGRIYDGALGRFVQADPIIQDPLRVQSLNRYSYVWNNPLNATDPSGFECDNTGSGNSCKQVAKEQTEKAEKEQKTDKPTDSGLKYKITDKKALEDWLKKNGKTMDDFTKAMEDKGISKAGFGDSGSTIGGVFVGKKGQTEARAVANQSGSNSGAANEINSPDYIGLPNKHTKDGKAANGEASFGEEKIAEIDKRMYAINTRLVGANGGTEGDVVDKTAIKLSQDKELMALSQEYGIEVGADIGADGTINTLFTDYHHRKLWSKLPGSERSSDFWHTHPGVTHRNNIIGQKEDIRGFSSGDFLTAKGAGGRTYATYPTDGSLYRMNPKLDGKIYEYSSGEWRYTGKRMGP